MGNFFKINCKEATYLISKKQEDKISFIDKIRLKAHIKICACCNLFNNQMQQLMDLLNAKPKETTQLSNSKKQTMKEEMQKMMKAE